MVEIGVWEEDCLNGSSCVRRTQIFHEQSHKNVEGEKVKPFVLLTIKWSSAISKLSRDVIEIIK